MFILSSTDLEFSPGNHTSIYQNSESKVLKNLWVKYLIIDQMMY